MEQKAVAAAAAVRKTNYIYILHHPAIRLPLPGPYKRIQLGVGEGEGQDLIADYRTECTRKTCLIKPRKKGTDVIAKMSSRASNTIAQRGT